MSTKYLFKQVIQSKCGFLRGPFGGDLKKEIFVEKGSDTYKVYEQGVVLNSDKRVGRYYISEIDYLAKLHKFSVQDKDFLVSCSGVNMGAIYQLKEPFERGIINQALLRIRLNTELIDDNYFYYLFKELISKKITSGSGDSTIPNFPGLDLIKNIEFELPLKNIQIKIGKILNDIDSKIELNSRINAELEAMAKTLYDYWFVQFDFPDANRKPYKTSGGKMFWNEELKREIPEGWEVKCLVDIESNIVTGKTPPTDNIEFYNGEIPFITIGDIRGNMHVINTEITLSKAGGDYQKNKYIPKGSLCVTCIASPGLIGFSSENSQTNQQINSIVIQNDENRTYLYYSLNDYFKFSKGAKTGNTFANMNKGDFEAIKIIYPYNQLLKKFEAFSTPIIEHILNRSRENQQLSELRDWLLPMLMTGQVTVGESAENKASYKIEVEMRIAAEPSGS